MPGEDECGRVCFRQTENHCIPRIHLQRAGRPDEIARAIVCLCSDEASYITGTTLTPDGGFTLTE